MIYQYCVPAQCATCGSLLCEECYNCPSEGHDIDCRQYIRSKVIKFLEDSIKEHPDIWYSLAESYRKRGL